MSRGILRMVIFLQVSPAFGRAMETVDRWKMCKLLYPFAMASHTGFTLRTGELSASIAAVAKGYSFPTNLDHDAPKGGLAPDTQQALFTLAIVEVMNKCRSKFGVAVQEQHDTDYKGSYFRHYFNYEIPFLNL